jgi:hypothetical protein
LRKLRLDDSGFARDEFISPLSCGVKPMSLPEGIVDSIPAIVKITMPPHADPGFVGTKVF